MKKTYIEKKQKEWKDLKEKEKKEARKLYKAGAIKNEKEYNHFRKINNQIDFLMVGILVLGLVAILTI